MLLSTCCAACSEEVNLHIRLELCVLNASVVHSSVGPKAKKEIPNYRF
jgi:hypothetical protein